MPRDPASDLSCTRSTITTASRRWRRPPSRSIRTTPPRAGTRRCSTTRRGPPARWSIHGAGRRRSCRTSSSSGSSANWRRTIRARRMPDGRCCWKAGSTGRRCRCRPKDMDFLEAKHTAAREIALAFGVPPMLLGIPGDNTYSNYQEANRVFWRATVLPLRLAHRRARCAHWLERRVRRKAAPCGRRRPDRRVSPPIARRCGAASPRRRS